MLGSSSHEEDEDPSPTPPPPAAAAAHHHLRYQHQSLTSPSNHMRQLLIRCAELISLSDFSAAHGLTTILSANSSPFGDSTERLVHQFTRALCLRLKHHHTPTTTTNIPAFLIPIISTASTNLNPASTSTADCDEFDERVVQSSYLSVNQITPFIRFSHLTANQAILDAIDQGHQSIHILDFHIMHGVQWPPLMQAISQRYPPPTLRITATGNNLDLLRRTGERLTKFAHSVGLSFQFHPLPLINNDDPLSVDSSVLILPNETLAVNCVLYLHRLNREKLRLLLHNIKGMNPKVVTVAEREGNHNLPRFLQRFGEALSHYTALFDSLEATLPPNSRERMAVEQVWFGREIADIVAAEGEMRRERHEKFGAWEVMLRSSGFENLPLSPFALSQAKLLLRLHYPSEGYQLDINNNDSFFLGWQNQPLFSVSSWR